MALSPLSSGELRDRHDHSDHDEHDDRNLHPDPGRRHLCEQPSRAAVQPDLRRSAARATIVLSMDRRVPRLAVGLVLALFTSGALAATGDAGQIAGASAAPAAPALLRGVNIAAVHPGALASEADSEIAQARTLHATVVRTSAPWSALEPTGPGAVDPGALAFLDRLVSDASAAGIRVILTADSTPCWAAAAPSQILAACRPGVEGEANAWPPRNVSDFAAYVAFLAGRYGTQLAAIEVWNEPDQSNEAYLAGPNKARNDAALLRAAYPAIKAANPGVAVLGGSLVGSNGAFLRALYAEGIKGFYDGLSVHFYTLTIASLRSIREVQLANGDTKPLWLDEFGWTSCWPRKIEQEQGCVTQQIQAVNFTDTLRTLARTPYVAAAVMYKLRDSRSEDFGLLSTSGARKPSYAAFANALISPLGRVSAVTVKLTTRRHRVVASGSGPVGDFMQLEAFRGRTLRFRALFTLDRFNRYSITLPAVLGTHGLRVRVFQLAGGVHRAASKSI
jgi:polysaccharide biosynthesis protein PslG